MFEYKVMEAANSLIAEKIMNDHAKEGWRVVSVVHWQNFRTLLIITFEREK